MPDRLNYTPPPSSTKIDDAEIETRVESEGLSFDNLLERLHFLQEHPSQEGEKTKRQLASSRLAQEIPYFKAVFIVDLHTLEPGRVSFREAEIILQQINLEQITEVAVMENLVGLYIRLQMLNGRFKESREFIAKFLEKFPNRKEVMKPVYKWCLLMPNCPDEEKKLFGEISVSCGGDLDRIYAKSAQKLEDKNQTLATIVTKFRQLTNGVKIHCATEIADEIEKFGKKYVGKILGEPDNDRLETRSPSEIVEELEMIIEMRLQKCGVDQSSGVRERARRNVRAKIALLEEVVKDNSGDTTLVTKIQDLILRTQKALSASIQKPAEPKNVKL